MKSPSLSAVALLAFSSGVGAFTVSTTSRTTRVSSTSLNLLPAQGKQLEAAANAALAKAQAEREQCEEEESECLPPSSEIESETKVRSAARNFVSKVFSIPSSIIRGHPRPELEGLGDADTFEWQDQPGDDVVLFPMVGFQFVNDAPNHYGVLPTARAGNPSCRLRNDGEQALVGWFSKACHLDMFAENYCDEPAE